MTETNMFQLVFPTDTNHLGNLFGGTLVAWMHKAAAYTAIRRAKSTVVTAHIDSIDFKVPIKQADIVEVTARVEEVGRTSMQVRHQSSTGPAPTGPGLLVGAPASSFVLLLARV